MPHRFMHVGFAFPGVPKVRDLEAAFLGEDWIRYSPLSWIVWTAKPAPELFAMIRPYIDANDQVLIAPIILDDAFGSLTPWIWEWMRGKMSMNALVSGSSLTNALAQYSLTLPKK